LVFDEPVVSHDKPGAADHSSVEWDVLFYPILSLERGKACGDEPPLFPLPHHKSHFKGP